MIDFFEVVKVLEITENIYPKIKNLSELGFLIFIGNLIDQWASDNGKDSEETCKILDRLATVQKDVHAKLGMAIPTEK